MCDYRLAYQEKAQPKRLTNLALTVHSYAPNFVKYEAVNEGVNKVFTEGLAKCLQREGYYRDCYQSVTAGLQGMYGSFILGMSEGCFQIQGYLQGCLRTSNCVT